MRVLLILAAFALAACSNDPDGTGARNATFRLAAERIGALAGKGPQTAPFTVTRTSIRDYPQPLIVVTRGEERAGLIPVGTNGPWKSWQTLDGIGFTLRLGVLSATRGFGADLLAAEVGETTALVTARRSGTARRVNRTLDGENQIIAESFQCEIANEGHDPVVVFEIRHETDRLRERCQPDAAGVAYENVYWVGSDGTIWASEQQITPATGRVFLEQLIK